MFLAALGLKVQIVTTWAICRRVGSLLKGLPSLQRRVFSLNMVEKVNVSHKDVPFR